MAINDFEYVQDPSDLSTFSTFEEGDLDVFTHSVGKAILKRDEAYRAIDALADAAGESWFELGEKLERKRVLSTIDTLIDKLVDSEEDAKMALTILREMIVNAQEEGNGEARGA